MTSLCSQKHIYVDAHSEESWLEPATLFLLANAEHGSILPSFELLFTDLVSLNALQDLCAWYQGQPRLCSY